MDNKTFQTNLKQMMQTRGLSQKDMADLLETTPTTVSRYITGDRTPPIQTVVEIAEHLGISIDDLCGYAPPTKPRQPLDEIFLLQCYQIASERDRRILWAVLDSYLTPEQRTVIDQTLNRDKPKAE